MTAQPLKFAIAGVGNCSSALLQGIEHSRSRANEPLSGVRFESIGGLRPADLRCVAAFDIDARKVGLPLEEAVFAAPNCVEKTVPSMSPTGVIVQMAPILDGIAPHMADYDEQVAFRPSKARPVDIVAALKESHAEALLCYLPVGSEQAVRMFAEACLEAGVAMVNCVPVFLASDPEWASRFAKAGLPIVGDDIKSQFGATIVHRTLARLLVDRGCKLDRTYQLNTGGNTDFLNMLARNRLASKKKSKTQSVQSSLDEPLPARDVHIGPSDYVPWQGDNKVAFIRLEGRGFCDAPIEMEIRLSVQDSPNSAGVVIDALRCVGLAKRHGMRGALEGVSAYAMKSPPRQMRDEIARAEIARFVEQF
jgi:myo-inositol-1-phosphate synthase